MILLIWLAFCAVGGLVVYWVERPVYVSPREARRKMRHFDGY